MFSERRVRLARVTALAALLLLLTGAGAAGVNASQATTLAPAGASLVTATPSCDPITRFDSNRFSNPTRIDNAWSPLVPGTQFILDGRADRGGGPLPHRVVFTVTDLTKVINGVRTAVMWDRDYNEGQLVEAELAFEAQDNDGNIWNLGEYPEEYEGGQFVGAPNTWIAGLAGAEAGSLMLAEPRLGTPSYLQGWAPDIGFLDCAKVLKTGQETCVPFDCYEGVLVTNEWSPLEPGGRQRKYYAPGVGNIQIGAVGDKEGETLVLVKIVHQSPGALAQARRAALKLDRHAYQVSPDLYGLTAPAEH